MLLTHAATNGFSISWVTKKKFQNYIVTKDVDKHKKN